MMTNETEYMEVDYKHPLSWRVSVTSPPTSLVLLSTNEPKDLKSSKGINVQKYKRNDGWALSFSLASEGLLSNFSVFCKSMVDSSRGVDPNKGADFVASQYLKWKEMFKNDNKGLIKLQIQGLFGEMLFIKDTLISRYGESVVLDSWVGPYMKKQDFQCPDLWYEVKTISEGKTEIQITSLDQLDRDDKGRLVVIRLREATKTSKSGTSINNLYYELMGILSPWQQCQFQAALANLGYEPSTEYDEWKFEFLSITEHDVSDDFPRLRRSKTNAGVADAVYEISLDAICRFEI